MLREIFQLSIGSFLALALACGGCATQAQRAADEQRDALISSYSAPDQARMRRGEIAVGDTKEMVVLALGEPAEKGDDDSARHSRSTWTYTRAMLVQGATDPATESLAEPYGFPVPGPKPLQSQPLVYSREKTMTVEFENGRVTAWHRFDALQ